jgi:hypothetical protein
MGFFKKYSCDSCNMWIPQLKSNNDLHSNYLNKHDLQIEELQEKINLLTMLAYGEPKNIASHQWIMWNEAKDELSTHYSMARCSIDEQKKKKEATEKYLKLKLAIKELEEDYHHLGKL